MDKDRENQPGNFSDKEAIFRAEASREIKRLLGEVLFILTDLKESVKETALSGSIETVVETLKLAKEYVELMAQTPYENSVSVYEVNEVIQRVLSLMDYQMRTRNISVHFCSSPEKLLVKGKQTNLLRSLLFILMNIVKLYEVIEGEKDLYIETLAFSGRVEIRIKDIVSTGDIDNYVTQLVLELIEKESGRVSFSITDEGRLFTIDLPHAEAESIPLRILIVDDDQMIREFLKDILEYLGQEVILTASPLKAMELLKREMIDLVLVDYRMPEMDGIKFIQMAKAYMPLERLFLLTGDTISCEVELARKREGINVLSKPLQINKLKELISLYRRVE